jgi:hypothetical protein
LQAKFFFFFFFFFSLALVSSFCRRLEEEGDGFGKLKSLQGIIYTPHSLTQLCTLLFFFFFGFSLGGGFLVSGRIINKA